MPIPQARSIAQKTGAVGISRTMIALDDPLEQAREGILAMLSLGESQPASDGAVIRFCADSALGQEAYRVQSGEDGVTVEAGGLAGAVYAAASIAQLTLEHGGMLPACTIEDAPRYGWRGVLLDVCRHFFPIETVYMLVDLMAYYKYNRLHLHISDDQGFRFESERYPLLNSVGSWRKSTQVKRGGTTKQDGIPHGGYYTKDALRALVRYAGARGIEIVPELDIPGHALAILASYPELSCFHEPLEVVTRFGVSDFSKTLFCAGSDKTYAFLFDLLDEIMEVFPASYFHIGGDETIKSEWKKCEACQRVRREQGLKNGHELQGYFLNRVIAYLEQHGKRVIVWNDGLCDTLSSTAIDQYWVPWTVNGPDRTARFVNKGGLAILSPVLREYYDYPYAATPLKKTYRFNPTLRGVRKASETSILGVEAAIWTEWIDTEEKLFFHTLPRLAATAETGWTQRGLLSYDGFLQRLQPHYALYDRLGLPYAKGKEHPANLFRRIWGTWTYFSKETHVELLEQQQRGNNRQLTKYSKDKKHMR